MVNDDVDIWSAAEEHQVLDIADCLDANRWCIDALQPESKRTALMIAANAGRERNLKYLIDSKASIDMTNHKEETALILASKNGYRSICCCLIKAGANSAFKGRGKTAAQYAEEQNFHVLATLITRNPDKWQVRRACFWFLKRHTNNLLCWRVAVLRCPDVASQTGPHFLGGSRARQLGLSHRMFELRPTSRSTKPTCSR